MSESPSFFKEHPLVFFTGGTALRALSGHLALNGPHSAHLVTTFDSGGSTARLRRAFAMPAVGDLRNRLLALAAPTPENDALVRCLKTRLPDSGDPTDLLHELEGMAAPGHPVWRDLKSVQAQCLQQCLSAFLRAMPEDFDAREASLGNVCMAGKYLQEHRSLHAVLGLFSRLLNVRGEVVPIVEESLHLAARLTDGSLVVGQHRFKTLQAPVREIFLTVSEPDRAGAPAPVPCRPRASTLALSRLREASLVCYPMGSFFSSLVANLLVDGVGATLAGLSCPRVFVPNTGDDAELAGHDLADELRTLLAVLAKDAPAGTQPCDLVTHVLLDTVNGRYRGDVRDLLAQASTLGVRVLDFRVVDSAGASHDPAATAKVLVDLALRWRDGARDRPAPVLQ